MIYRIPGNFWQVQIFSCFIQCQTGRTFRLNTKKSSNSLTLGLFACQYIPCLYTSLSLYIPVSIHPCLYTPLSLYTPVSIHPCLYTSLSLYIPVSIHPCLYTPLSLYIPVSIHPCLYTSLSLYTPVSIHPCLYTPQYTLATIKVTNESAPSNNVCTLPDHAVHIT